MVTDLTEGIPQSYENALESGFMRPWTDAEQSIQDELGTLGEDAAPDIAPADLAEDPAAEALVPAATPAGEAPSVSRNPLQAELYRPWMEEEQARQEKLAAWRAAESAKLDRAVLDWENATAGKQIALDFAPDPDTARMQALVESYLFIENEGREFRSRAERDGLRDQLAYHIFGGKGIGDDSAFFAEVEKVSKKRTDVRAFATTLAEDAQLSELVRSSTDYEADARSWELWQEEHKTQPGYDPQRVAEYYAHWNEIRSDTRAHIQPVLGPLREAWHLMQEEKGYLGFNLRGLYDQMADDGERAKFIASLSLLARTLPPEQQATFWGNIAKTNDRAWQGYVQDAFEWSEMQVVPELREMERLLDQADPDPWKITPTLARNVTEQILPLGSIQKKTRELFTAEGQQSAAKAEEVRAELRRRQNFRDDIERIRDEDYDPVRVLSPDGSAAAFGEKFAYGLTGTMPTIAGASIPWAGLVITYGTSERMLYRDLRRSFMTSDGVTPGLSDAEASQLSGKIAPILAIPYAAIEKLKIEGMLGKLPFTEKVMNALGSRVTNSLLRGGTRIGTEAGFQTIGENLQDALPVITQQLVSALSEDLKVPGVVLRNGKDGYLDGYWEKTALTYTIMLPLSIAAAAGGRDRDARARSFAKASDTELLALIGSKEAVAKIREAQQRGPFSANAAIEEALAKRNPFTPEAKAAVEELEREAAARKAAVDEAQDAGLVPAIRGNRENGYTVSDPETRKLIGTAKDWQGAEQLAAAHSKVLDEKNKDAVAYYGSLLEAADLASGGKTREGDQTIFDIAPGSRMDLAEAELLSPGLEQRHAEQASIRERLAGGDGKTLWSILGLSITDTQGLSRDVRKTVNYLRNGATVREVIHEKTHGFRREAKARGRLTRDDEVAIVRAFDNVTRGKQTRGADGGRVQLAFLPEGIADTEITDTMLDEAISEIMEVELMRMAKRGSRRGQADSERAQGIGTASRVTVKNITAALKLLSPAAAQRFSHFMEAARSYFGLVFGRTAAINKAERDGKFDRQSADAFIDKLFGLDGAQGSGKAELQETSGESQEATSEADASLDSEELSGAALSIEPEGRLDGPFNKPHTITDAEFRDPGRILESLAPGEGGSSLRSNEGKRRKSGREILSPAGILAWAERHGQVFPTRAAEALSGSEVGRGGEHLVIYLPEGDRVFKLTKPGFFGAQGEDAGAYLRRWAFHNRAFGDDTAFEGFVTLEGEDLPRAVISQRFAKGRDATTEELADYLVEKGFHEMPDGKWIHPIRGYELWDTITPGNAIMTDQGVQVIDLQLGPADPVALAELRERSGIGRGTAFSLGPEKMAEILGGLGELPKVMRDVRGSGQVKAVRDEIVGKPLTNLATGMVATVSGGSLHKMLSSSAVLRSVSPQAHMMALGNIDHLFRLAILEQTRDGKKDIDENRIAGIHHLIVPLSFEDQVLEVRIMAKEFLNPAYGNRLYLIQAAKIVTPASLTGEASTPEDEREPHRPAGVEEIFARMVEAVKMGPRRLERSTGQSDGQADFEAADSPGNVLGTTYQPVPEQNLPDWARRGLEAARKAPGAPDHLRLVLLGYEDRPGKGNALRFSKDLFSVFRKRVLFVKSIEGSPLPFDAFVNPDDPNTIVVDADSRQGLTYLFGHELGHSIQHQRPDLYDAFQRELLAMADDWGDYREKLRGSYQTDEQFRAEFTNDFIGNQMDDPAFWERLQERNPGVFRRLVDAALEFLKELGRKIGTLERDVRPYFRDIESARASLVKMLEDYQRGAMPERSVRPRELAEPGDDNELSRKADRR